jgi:hypothetical protein
MTTDDTHLSERMAAVLAGRSDWSAPEAQHLAACAECREEWALLERARALGRAAPPLDVAAIAGAAVSRASAARRRDRWTRRSPWLALAAAAAIALVALPRGGRPVTGPSMAVAIAELDGLGAADLQLVLEAVEAGLPGTAAAEDEEAAGPDAAALEAVLSGLEG